MHALKAYIEDKKSLLSDHTAKFLQEKQRTGKSLPFFYDDALQKLFAVVPKGKMLRGVLSILSYELCGGVVNEKTLNIAAALQLACDGLLIIDDFMDNSPTRRGQTSIFRQYADSAQTENGVNPLLYGQSMCVCVSDMTFFFAMELLAFASENPQVNQTVQLKFAEEFQTVASGQMLDVYFSMSKKEPTEKEIQLINKYKTAHYTCVLPLALGAIAAEAPTDLVRNLAQLGEKLGLIFQLHDDELDLYGDEHLTGKPVGGDIRENKKTLWRNRLFAKANGNDHSFLDTCFGNPSLSSEHIQRIIALTESYGVKKEIEHEKKQLADSCYEIITRLDCEQKYKDILSQFIEYNVNRPK